MRTLLVITGLATLVLASGRPSAGHADALSAEPVDDEPLVPRREVGYRNGRKLAVDVVTIGWADVEVSTAKAFLAMRASAAVDGIDLAIRSGFRTMEQQRWLYDAWKGGYGNKAGRPGRSNHQAGKALDLYLDSVDTFAWLETHAKRFGFERTVVGEPWHWEYVKKPAKKKRSKRGRR